MALGRIALALLGLGVIAYSNRDRLGALLGGRDRSGLDPSRPQTPEEAGVLEQILDGVGSSGGFEDILQAFRNAGRSMEVDSWIRKGANLPISPEDVETAIDSETIAELSRHTGLSRDELLERLSRELPDAIDSMTPEGRVPDRAAA